VRTGHVSGHRDNFLGGERIQQTKSTPQNQLRSSDPITFVITALTPLGASVRIGAPDVDGEASTEGAEELLGLLYNDEILMEESRRGGRMLDVGDRIDGYVRKVRDDGKVDVQIRRSGYENVVNDVCQMILSKLEGEVGGAIHVGDKSTPEEIMEMFPGVSKKRFKVGLGKLLKEGKVEVTGGGVGVQLSK